MEDKSEVEKIMMTMVSPEYIQKATEKTQKIVLWEYEGTVRP